MTQGDDALNRCRNSIRRQYPSIRRNLLRKKQGTENERPSKTVERTNAARRAGRTGLMLQLAAALLFTLAAGLGIAVILGMLKVNGEAVLSALAGEGAFPAATGPRTGPAPQTIPL